MPLVKLDSRGIEIVKRQVGPETRYRILVSTESATVLELYTSSEASTEQFAAAE